MILIPPPLIPTLSTKSRVHTTDGSHPTAPDSHSVHKVTCPYHRWFSSNRSRLPHCPQSHVSIPPMVLIQPLPTPTLSTKSCVHTTDGSHLTAPDSHTVHKVTCPGLRWFSSHLSRLPLCPQSHVSIPPMVLIQPLPTPTLSTKSRVQASVGSHPTTRDSHTVHKVTCPYHRWFSSNRSRLPHSPQSHVCRPPLVLIPPLLTPEQSTKSRVHTTDGSHPTAPDSHTVQKSHVSITHNTNGSHPTAPDSHTVHKVTCPYHRWFLSNRSLLPHCPKKSRVHTTDGSHPITPYSHTVHKVTCP